MSKFFGLGKRSKGSRNVNQQDSSHVTSTHNNSSDEENNDDLVSQVTNSLQSTSIFSKGRNTLGTGASSTLTGDSYGYDKKGGNAGLFNVNKTSGDGREDVGSSNVGKPLRVLDYDRLTSLNPVIEEEDTSLLDYGEEYSGSNMLLKHGSSGMNASRKLERSPTSSLEVLESELKRLNENLVALMDDIHQNVINISKAVIQAIEFLKKFLPDTTRITFTVTMANSSCLRSIAKIVFHFVDNLLNTAAFQNPKSILLKAYLGFLQKLNINVFEDSMDDVHTLPAMKNFAIYDKCGLPNRDKLSNIVDEIVRADPSSIADQEGAFIAPILRGLSKKSAVLTVMFGIPNPCLLYTSRCV